MRTILTILLITAATAAAAAAAEPPEYRSSQRAPAGLELYLQGRAAEVHGDVREALRLYEKAVQAAPEVNEIRVAYAALLHAVGLVDEAVDQLRGRSGLDWFGTRTLGLALVQLGAREPELLAEARTALEAAVAERPDDTSAQMALVQVLERQGEVEQAEAIVARLRRARPASPQLQLVHGSLLQRLGRHQAATEALGACAETEPFAGACRERLVESLVALGRFEESGRLVLEHSEPTDQDQLLQAAALLSEGGDPEEALAVVRRVLEAHPESVPARRLEAILLSSMGRFDDAVVRLRRLRREAPDDLQLALALAWAEGRLGRDGEARTILEDVWRQVGKDPGSEGALRVAAAAARLELIAGRSGGAREWLQRVDPTAAGPEWVRMLVETYRRDQQWREGVAAMLRLQPRLQGDARDQARAAEAEFRLRLGERDAAMRTLRPLVGSDDVMRVGAALEVLQRLELWQEVVEAAAAARARLPEDRMLAFAEGAAWERLGEHEKAEALFRSLLEQEPEDAATANYLGYMWADAGVNLEEALQLIRQAVTLDPTNDAYLDSLGWVHYRLGNLQEAETWLRRAVQLGGTDGTVLAHLGEVLLAMDRTAEARSLLQRALELGVEEPERVRGLLEELPSTP